MASRAAPASDLGPTARATLTASTVGLIAVSLVALARAGLGLAPTPAWAKDAALAVHLATVIPAMPLGLHLFLARKGDARHRALGRLWLGLMATTAVSTLFVKHLNPGSFSFVHLFSVLTLVTVPRAILAARRGDIAAHRAHLLGLFVGAIVVAGLFSFTPGRLMTAWLFG